MTENDTFIIEMNIARYREMLQRDLDGEKRVLIERLLREAETDLMLSWFEKKPR